MPDDLAEQIPWVHQACEAMGVPIFTAPGFEADDVIGTLAVRAASAGYDVAIVTGDKDFFQLVGGPIRVFNPRDEGAWFDSDGVKEKFVSGDPKGKGAPAAENDRWVVRRPRTKNHPHFAFIFYTYL